jgi:DNA repair protein RadC
MTKPSPDSGKGATPADHAKGHRANIEVTKDIKKALAVMGIALHDHLIVAGTSCVSFKSLGHL